MNVTSLVKCSENAAPCVVPGAAFGATQGNPVIAAGDLADLLCAVNEATARLEDSHQQLQAQVARLTLDLTQTQQQLERARRLAALGEMAAGIAHEIRNPLGPVRLYAGMLSEDLATISPPHAALAKKITAASRVMEGIVSDVLTFARELRPRWAVVSLDDVCDGALAECSLAGVGCGVQITRAYQQDTEVEADPALLRQALVNVMRNAMEAMAECPAPLDGHKLHVEISPTPGEPRRLAVLVSDTGPGVTPEVEARMFNPFYTTRNTGTGLGLAIVHRIIDAHQGCVRVRREREKIGGATFEIQIPVRATKDPNKT
jgi:signal transduction histidine kinase